jgi:hypothetical protein
VASLDDDARVGVGHAPASRDAAGAAARGTGASESRLTSGRRPTDEVMARRPGDAPGSTVHERRAIGIAQGWIAIKRRMTAIKQGYERNQAADDGDQAGV